MWAAYAYPIALVAISAFVATLEALFPWRKQKQLRRGLLSDLAHLVFNGHFLGIVFYILATQEILPRLDAALSAIGLETILYRKIAESWPIWVQIAVALFSIDFLQWCVHNTLHRVPFLWRFHQTHHSVVDGEMDWIVSFRFEWTEVVVYKAVLYFPLAFFGFGQTAVLVHAIFGTLIGHLNHSNLKLDWGPLRYVLNSPRMHIWHHERIPDASGAKNFGIIFSLWDWIFGTAKMPNDPPEQIGFLGVEQHPRGFVAHAGLPIARLLPAPLQKQAAPVIGFVLLAAVGWLIV
jgi:sterol desaturase/sphingolipid hydroxylase (fatty acid hydroxylase superfamily)